MLEFVGAGYLDHGSWSAGLAVPGDDKVRLAKFLPGDIGLRLSSSLEDWNSVVGFRLFNLLPFVIRRYSSFGAPVLFDVLGVVRWCLVPT